SEMSGKKNDYCMVGYRVGNTLSESGSVARGVCEKDANDYLTTVVERTAIERVDGKVSFKDENGKMVSIDDNTPVSMNMWGFTPDYFKYSEDFFINFLKENSSNLKSEYFIPLMVNELINNGTARVKVLDTTSKWFGVTYAADRQSVVDKIKALVDAGEYPSKLF
ncbi:MAG: nucleotidyltransferase, partial [Bacteroidaceae bacterium]